MEMIKIKNPLTVLMKMIKIINPFTELITQSKSAEIIGSNEDLLTEIFLRLPVKSLIDFKLVSKQWHSIITNPKFFHVRRQKTDPAIGLFLLNNISFDYIPFSKQAGKRKTPQLILKGFSGITILQSCNGLLLCRINKAPDYDKKYLVCNPTTKHFSFIPKLDIIQIRPIHSMALAFDPTKSPHYHVVCVHEWQRIYPNQFDAQFQIQIYSSETRSWKICGDPFLGMPIYRHPVYWNGAVHWICFWNREHTYFNIDRRVLHVMPKSRLIEKRWVNGGGSIGVQYFEESHHHLHLFTNYESKLKFNVYELKRDFSEWFVKYTVDLSPVAVAYPDMIANRQYSYLFHVLSLVPGEDNGDEEPFLVLHIPKKVVRYNLVSMTTEMLHEIVGDEGEKEREKFIKRDVFLYHRRGFKYIESLSHV